ncbi:SDR family NAD(P)-dependent oxidoreductase [Psychrobacillus sp.]|uniref:NAD-dependent epimerase/dehydratase family protein n=1 Tax=Psychrobacillus sp. TaxID=1871623 RepID=UPI0028BD818E|nr:SDR family NAD(P)-dependent oxidoreductase [Psychrobacillus sp.]
MKKVLITGATGFIGGALAHRLVEQNVEVHVFIREHSDIWRLQKIQRSIFIHVVDLRDLSTLKEKVKEINPNVIYHCATHGGYHFQNNTTEIIESNFIGTVNLLTACLEIEFDYFVNTGSSSEYGIKNHMHREGDVLFPLGDYAVSKAAATLYCQSMRLQRELPIITLRLFSPYGPWDAPSRFIPYVIKSYIQHESPKISTPSSVRDYIYIDDVIDAYLRFLHLKYLDCDILNIGSGNQTKLAKIVEIVQGKTNNEIQPMWGENQVRKEPEMWQADISLANEVLKWSPKVTIEDGLQNTIDWMRNKITYY